MQNHYSERSNKSILEEQSLLSEPEAGSYALPALLGILKWSDPSIQPNFVEQITDI